VLGPEQLKASKTIPKDLLGKVGAEDSPRRHQGSQTSAILDFQGPPECARSQRSALPWPLRPRELPCAHPTTPPQVPLSYFLGTLGAWPPPLSAGLAHAADTALQGP
jgi:hypothetical protein